jgi:hypothetical protein
MPQQYGQWPLNVCQMGQETTAGTAANATAIWRGPFGHFEDDDQTEEIEEDIGTFGRTQQEYTTWQSVVVPFPTASLNFLQIPHILQSSIGVVTPTGAGPYIRQYDAVFGDTDPTLKPYTLRLGNKRVTADVWNVPYSLCQEWELSGKQGELWKVSGNWTAPRRVAGSFTANVPLANFEPALFAKTLLYIDDSGGTIGTTQKTGVLIAASIKWKTNIEWVPVGDGNTYGVAYKLGRPTINFSLTLEVEQDGGASVVGTERQKRDSRSYRLIRLRLSGSGNNAMDIDMAAKYDKAGPYNKEGETNTTNMFEGRVLYSSADSKFFGIKHTSDLATIP